MQKHMYVLPVHDHIVIDLISPVRTPQLSHIYVPASYPFDSFQWMRTLCNLISLGDCDQMVELCTFDWASDRRASL